MHDLIGRKDLLSFCRTPANSNRRKSVDQLYALANVDQLLDKNDSSILTHKMIRPFLSEKIIRIQDIIEVVQVPSMNLEKMSVRCYRPFTTTLKT